MTQPPDPPAPGLPPPGPRPSPIRSVALGAIVFVATLILLLGATRLVDRMSGAPSPSGPGSAASQGPSRPASPVPGSGGAGASPSGSPDAPSAGVTAAPGDPVLVGAGDIGDCGSAGDEATADLLDTIPGTVFTTGDNAYENGTPEEFAQCYAPSWGRHRDRTRPAPGNHDWGTPDLAGYFGYFGAAAQGPGGVSWYSYDLGTWHVIVLDSKCEEVGGCGPESVQGRWLAADLAASDAVCTVALFHHPRWSSGEHGDGPEVDPLWRQLHGAGVDVVLNGHDHDYERFAPQDPDGTEDRERGIRQFVVGTGGAPLRDFPRAARNSELRAAVAHGVLAMTLREGTYDWAFVPVEGEFSDRGSARCH